MIFVPQTPKEKYMSKKVEKSVCPICGKKFVKKAVNQKYCSAKCKCVAKRQAEKTKKCSTGNNKEAKKPVAKKIEEKVKLPKPPAKKPDVIVLVHGSDPYKKFAIALQIAIREFGKIVAATQLVTKKGK